MRERERPAPAIDACGLGGAHFPAWRESRDIVGRGFLACFGLNIFFGVGRVGGWWAECCLGSQCEEGREQSKTGSLHTHSLYKLRLHRERHALQCTTLALVSVVGLEYSFCQRPRRQNSHSRLSLEAISLGTNGFTRDPVCSNVRHKNTQLWRGMTCSEHPSGARTVQCGLRWRNVQFSHPHAGKYIRVQLCTALYIHITPHVSGKSAGAQTVPKTMQDDEGWEKNALHPP